MIKYGYIEQDHRKFFELKRNENCKAELSSVIGIKKFKEKAGDGLIDTDKKTNKKSKKKKFCSTDNYNNQIYSKNSSTNNNINNQNKANTIKIESKVIVVKKKNKDDDDNIDNNKKEKDKESIKLSDEKVRNKEKKFDFIKKGEKIILI